MTKLQKSTIRTFVNFRVFLATLVIFGALIFVLHGWSQVDVTMRGYTTDRNGWSNNSGLTQDKIITSGLRMVPSGAIGLYGDARGSEGATLLMHGVKTAKGTRNLLLYATMADYVQAFDSTTGLEIWRTHLGVAVNGNVSIDMHLVNQHWGCLATGVIWKGLLYLDCQVSPDGTGSINSGRYFFFVLDPTNGAVLAQVSSQDNNRLWKKRGSLTAFTNTAGRDTVCDTFGSVYETSDGFTGGVTCLDVTQRQVVLQWKDSAGSWNGGEGAVLDSKGKIHLMTGNGAFDPSKGWYGESFVRAAYVYDGTNPATFTPEDDFSPFTDYWRSGVKDPYLVVPKLSGVNAMSEVIASAPVNGAMAMGAMAGSTVKTDVSPSGQVAIRVYPDPVMAKGGNSDLDLGSGGYVYIKEFDAIYGGGKDGLLYGLHAGKMGGTTLVSVQNHHGNCLNLIGSAPVFATAYVGNVDPCTETAADLNFMPVNTNGLNGRPVAVTAHIHMTPVVMRLPSGDIHLFVWGENISLHEWELHANAKPTYVTESNEFASSDVRGNSPGGMTGGMVTGCSNGNDPLSYLIIASVPYGDANAPRGGGPTTAGRLLVYDAIHLDASGHIKLLWDSQRWGINYAFNKFMPPTCADGHVYLPTYDGRVLNLM
jgi:hypothetical protein